MTFDFDAASILEDSFLPLALAGGAAAGFGQTDALPRPETATLQPAPATLQEALAEAAAAACGCASRGAERAPILATVPAERAELTLIELRAEDREPEYVRFLDGARRFGGWHGITAEALSPAAPLEFAAASEAESKPTKLLRAGFDDVNGDGVQDEPIIVTGTNPDAAWAAFWSTGGWTWGGHETNHPPLAPLEEPAPTPPDLECLSDEEKSQLSPKEREAYEVAEEAAEIAREILARPDRDTVEYGALIYRDVNGVITHTPLARGTATTVQMDITGLPGYGSVLALVHSILRPPGQATTSNCFPPRGKTETGPLLTIKSTSPIVI